ASVGLSLNMLLESVEPALRAQDERAYLEEWARHLVENAGRLSEGMTPDPDSMPVMGNAMDSLSVVVSYMQASNQRRLARLKMLADDIGSLTTQGHGVVSGTDEQIREVHRISGAVVSVMDTLVTRTRQRVDALERIRRMLATVLPPEITNMPEQAQRPDGFATSDAGRLQELDIHIGIDRTGYTDEFAAIQPERTGYEEDIPPLPRPLEAIPGAAEDGIEAKSNSRRKGSSKSDQIPAELIEVWTMLVQLTAEIEQEERTFAPLPRDLG